MKLSMCGVKTVKDVMRENFIASLYKPLLSKYVDWLDIICMNEGDKIKVNITEGKLDDGIYILERKGASLFFYKSGFFKKILIVNQEGILSFTYNQFKKATGVSGAIIKTKQWQRFFAKQ